MHIRTALVSLFLIALILFSTPFSLVAEGRDMTGVMQRFDSQNKEVESDNFNRKRECAEKYHPKLGKQKDEALYKNCLEQSFESYQADKKKMYDRVLDDARFPSQEIQNK